MSPALETCLGLIICHQWIPEKNVCLAVITSEQGVIPLGLGLLTWPFGCCPHQGLRAPWNSLLNLAKGRIMLVFTLLNPWRIAEHFNTLPLLPDLQVPHEVSAGSIQEEGLALVNNTAPELPSLSVTHASSSAVNLSRHVSNEFPIKLAVWPSSVLFSLFSFDYAQVIFLEAGD